jgi:arylsulfatase A-like enzyme
VGVLGLRGPGVRSNLKLPEASILDVAPTILHYLGLPIPAHMDGRVLTAAFDDAFNAANPVQTIASDLESGGDDDVYTAEEEEMVMEKLRDLGYVA